MCCVFLVTLLFIRYVLWFQNADSKESDNQVICLLIEWVKYFVVNNVSFEFRLERHQFVLHFATVGTFNVLLYNLVKLSSNFKSIAYKLLLVRRLSQTTFGMTHLFPPLSCRRTRILFSKHVLMIWLIQCWKLKPLILTFLTYYVVCFVHTRLSI